MNRPDQPQPKQPEPSDLELLDWTVSLSPELKQILQSEKERIERLHKIPSSLNEIKHRLD